MPLTTSQHPIGTISANVSLESSIPTGSYKQKWYRITYNNNDLDSEDLKYNQVDILKYLKYVYLL